MASKGSPKREYGSEQVFVVEYSNTGKVPDGFTRTTETLVDTEPGRYVLRSIAEGEPCIQQLIPCLVVRDEDGRFFVSRRISGEDRLVGKLSLTFGGHINPCDGYKNPIDNCLHREVLEETTLDNVKYVNFKKIGYVRDLTSSTPDHIGIVYETVILNKTRSKMKIRETDKLEGVWMTLEEMIRKYGKFEGWAQKLIQDYTLEGFNVRH